MMSNVLDAVIIGAGPIGLELAVRMKQAGLTFAHFDAQQIGQTISWFAPQTQFFSSNERIAIAGVPLQTADQGKATREEYLAYLRSIVLQFNLKVNAYEPVTAIVRGNDGTFIVASQPRGRDKLLTHCRAVVLSTGGTDRPRKLNIPGEDLPHVSNYFQDPHTYFGQNLLIVGGKNSAVEAALRCHHAGAKVSISYRRDRLPEKSIKYWLMPEISGLTDAGRITAHYGTQPVAITPTHVALSRGGDHINVPADFVLLMVGYEQDNTLLISAGVTLTESCRAPVFDPQTMETNVPGIYVAGTAVGGTQDKYTVFIENCHVHVERIVAALTGASAPKSAAVEYARPES